MTSLTQLQQAFLDDLTGDDRGNLESLVLDDGKVDLSTRLGIYRNAYLVRLRDALGTDHEILQLYIGEQAFTELAEDYVAEQPSRGYSLRHLGDGLAAFLATHPRYGQLPVLAELAEFERLLLSAFDAANAHRVSLDDLARLAPELWPGLTLEWHPSVRLATFAHGPVEIWQALKQDRTPPQASATPTAWVIYRNAQRLTEFRSVPTDEWAVLSLAQHGAPFSDVCSALLEWHATQDAATRAAQLIQTWVSEGLVIGLTQSSGAPSPSPN